MKKFSQPVDTIVVHCSATVPESPTGARQIDHMHRLRGFAMIGYHFVIRRDGTLEKGRSMDYIGAHVQGHNAHTYGVCLEGGVQADGTPVNNYTPEQMTTLASTARTLCRVIEEKWDIAATVVGHRDLFGDTNGDGEVDEQDWLKECPCFDVKQWWAGLKP